MKFRDGYWGLKKDVTLHSPVEVRDIEKGNGTLTVYSACKRVAHRGDTLNAPMLTMRFSSPSPDIIHVRIYHFKGALDRAPHFDLTEDVPNLAGITEGADAVTLTSGDLSVSVGRKGDWRTQFSYRGRNLTEISGRNSGHLIVGSGDSYMSQHLSLSVGESVYGLGERFTPFVKNGQVVDIWNEDGGTSSEQAYKNIPFYLTSKGYGVLVANPGRVSFEVASEVVSSVQFSVPGEFLDYYIIGGEEPKDVLRTYAKLAGKPALPPPWSFGLWLTTSFTTSYDEKTVNSFVDGMAERNIPLHVFHFDCFWMKEFQWVDFEWDPVQFPDPAGMIVRLKKRGLKICVWINPYIAQKSRLFDEGMQHGYLVKNPDGSVWQWDRWQAGMGLVDFTNPDATAWYQAALRKLLDMGVDTFKTDFGERIPTDVVYADGSDPIRMHNYYTYLYNKSVFELLEKVNGRNNALVFARSATVGGQKFPVHWGGDCSAKYESMAESLRGGLSLALSGFGFWSHDIGGFENTATPDLFKRWIAFGLLSSHSRLHGNESYRVPWNFDDESSDVLRFFVQLKCRLMPYVFAHAVGAAHEGVPLMRAMMMEFPRDRTCASVDQQYMLGDSLLVAPIFGPDGNVTYYLPEGRWTNFITGERVDGGSWRTENHGYMSVPLMARPNSIVAVGPNESRPDYDFAENVCYHLFEPEDGTSKSAAVYAHDGTVEAAVTVTRTANVINIEPTGDDSGKPWSVCLRGVQSAAAVSGGTASAASVGLVVQAAGGSRGIRITL